MEEKKKDINTWLEKLQRESWNLELLISGFSIFLLIQATQSFDEVLNYISFHYNFENAIQLIIFSCLGAIYIGAFALIINLIIHILLRGFWIGAVGLRSVQESTDFEKLNYSSFFTNKLKTKVGNLDDILIKLDTVCSAIFAFSFLIVFMFISLGLTLTFFGVIEYLFRSLVDLFDETSLMHDIINYSFMGIVLLFFVSSLIYLIDTLSLGFFKKYNWLSKIYYPIYTVLSFITMSKIYRAIYYNLISRFSKGKIRILLFIYLFALFIIPVSNFNQYHFFPDNKTPNKIYSSNYDNLRVADRFIYDASIPSNIITDQYLPLFIRYDVSHNDLLRKLCTDYIPNKTGVFQPGIKFDSGIQIGEADVEEEDAEKLLNCLSSFYTLYINDSLFNKNEYFFYNHPNKNEYGLLTTLDIRHLEKGQNTIKIDIQHEAKKDSIISKEYVRFPFWLQ